MRRRSKADDNDRGLHLDVPDFEGTKNPNDFVDWLNSMERLFEYKGYTDEKQFKVAILKLKNYASLLWENIRRQRERERDGKERIKTWVKLKNCSIGGSCQIPTNKTYFYNLIP
ncbi:hypothetical protein CFOL_v3_23486 [Cephalotus follicularis]|uniref:Uncharacterized protein n=1 Tax=Cephalotus follicularis TaxID=3775 RepID=A0A1Q3CIC9_CEPFO|nr:hypothetical protein CFOL_v3_23486 [Cephalotus follicularis]